MTMVIITETRRELKKQETRKKLLSTGIRLITERGIDAVTVEEIAALADVGKGTVYNYFRTKDDIVVAFQVEIERHVQARLARWTTAQGSLEEILTAFITYQFRLKRPHYKFVRIFLAQMFLRTEQLFPYILELQSVIDPPIRQLFESLQQRRLLRKDVDMPLLIHQFKTFHLGLTAAWAIEGPPWRGTLEVLPRQVSLFCQGLEERKRR
jgi:AcrR family transcriptional regulator